jgi:SAM-dependent methyltransferase
MEAIAAANAEAVEAWNGVLFDRFLKYRHIFTTGLGEHGDAAMRLYPPPEGGRVLDIGCGFGDTTQQLAALVGPAGEAVGIDSSDRFIEKSIEEAEAAGVENVRFLVGDVQVAELDERFDYAFSRMGTMFFASPVAALRNVRNALEPGGVFCMVVWRRKIENEWVSKAEEVVLHHIDHPDPEDSDEPTCGPGPFSMANADTVSMQLQAAGFEDIAFHRSDIPMVTGKDVDEAIEVVTALGPAAEIIRLAGEQGEAARPQIEAELREMIEANYLDPDDGIVRGPASCWIVSARVPG